MTQVRHDSQDASPPAGRGRAGLETQDTYPIAQSVLVNQITITVYRCSS